MEFAAIPPPPDIQFRSGSAKEGNFVLTIKTSAPSAAPVLTLHSELIQPNPKRIAIKTNIGCGTACFKSKSFEISY